MKIEAGKYYRTRGGQVFGPMVRVEEPTTKYIWCLSHVLDEPSWDEEGVLRRGWSGPFDLISEVHVSDTPQVNTTKTARDELVEKAALAILTGRHANPGPTFSYGNKGLWSAAEEFVEARKK